METPGLEGVIPILVTPFDEAGDVDAESLRGLVEFLLAAGVHGLGVALGSEVFRLTEAERFRVARTVVEQARGRVPVVVHTGGQGTETAICYSRAAAEAGADFLMLTPPAIVPAGAAETAAYFRAVGAAVGLPQVIQDAGQPPLTAALACRIAEESPLARTIKVESPPPPVRVGEAVARAGHLLTVIGGAGGAYLIEEVRRGSRGTMPGCSQPEAFAAVWERCRAADWAGARALFERTIARVNRIESLGWNAFYHVHKELLRRRGVIRCARVRGPIDPVDGQVAREVEELIEELYPA